MKEIKDFDHIIEYLFQISECPNFSDEMRNKASDLSSYIENNSEPEVIIKKSGETLVANGNGVDYMWTRHIIPWDSDENPVLFSLTTGEVLAGWKTISEIEITDEIAKLRPMVVTPRGDLHILIYVGECIHVPKFGFPIGSVRLATVDDL